MQPTSLYQPPYTLMCAAADVQWRIQRSGVGTAGGGSHAILNVRSFFCLFVGKIVLKKRVRILTKFSKSTACGKNG